MGHDRDRDFNEQQYILRVPPELASRVQKLIIDYQKDKLVRKRMEKKGTEASSTTGKNNNASKKMTTTTTAAPHQKLLHQKTTTTTTTTAKKSSSSADAVDDAWEPSLNVEFDSERHGRLIFSYPSKDSPPVMIEEEYECLVVDMPTVIESYKSLDLETYYKCGQTSKMVLVTTEEFERKQRDRMRHWLHNPDSDKPIVRKKSTPSGSSASRKKGSTGALAPHQLQQRKNEEKRERELREQRAGQQKKEEEEQRKLEREAAIQRATPAPGELDPNVYHSGISPSLTNIYEYWENTKVNVSREEVKRMVNNYYKWLFDEKDFTIEKVEEKDVGRNSITSPTTPGTTPMTDALSASSEGSEEVAAFDREWNAELQNLDRNVNPLAEMRNEMDDEASSSSFDDVMSSGSDDMFDDEGSDEHEPQTEDVQNEIARLGTERNQLLKVLNNTKQQISQLQRSIASIGNPMLRQQSQTELDARTKHHDALSSQLSSLNSKILQLQRRR